MKTHDPKDMNETSPPEERPRRRRPYAPPAIEQASTIELVSLGSPGHGNPGTPGQGPCNP